MHTAESLIAFTNRVADAFRVKQIRSPVHLCSSSQAQYLIDIFKDIQPHDWIFCTWRSAFHCLLKGMPEDELFARIIDGQSMFICSKEHRIISSAIVGGALPVALGVALGIKRRKGYERVWAFVGDMAYSTGLFREFDRFCLGHDLRVTAVLESNGYSTDTPTQVAWGTDWGRNVQRRDYGYERDWPHCGVGSHVSF